MKLVQPIKKQKMEDGSVVAMPLQYNIVGVNPKTKTFICELAMLEKILIDSTVPKGLAKLITQKIIEKTDKTINDILPLPTNKESIQILCDHIDKHIQSVLFEHGIEGVYLSSQGNLLFKR